MQDMLRWDARLGAAFFWQVVFNELVYTSKVYMRHCCVIGALSLKPSTLNPQPSTLDPELVVASKVYIYCLLELVSKVNMRHCCVIGALSSLASHLVLNAPPPLWCVRSCACTCMRSSLHTLSFHNPHCTAWGVWYEEYGNGEYGIGKEPICTSTLTTCAPLPGCRFHMAARAHPRSLPGRCRLRCRRVAVASSRSSEENWPSYVFQLCSR